MTDEAKPSMTLPKRRDALVLRVYQAEEDLRELAESLGVDLRALAKLALDPQVVQALRGLRELAESQSQLILSRCRMTAAAKLVELAGQNDDGELARKASVDLLKLDLLPKPDPHDEKPDAEPRRISPTKVLEALERIGRDDPA